jgi:dGTPase
VLLDPRDERFYATDRGPDQRRPSQRDRDRIIYTSAFRRLAWVTQVVASGEGEPFHNRLTHTLEVAQVGRRLAEKLLAEQPEEAEGLGGVDPEAVEAAALAHDLGHPPFGHVAEEELDRLMIKAGVHDGFEGNPQSFRVVTKLAIRNPEFPGLNLTRATLDAILKYPWYRQTIPGRHRKWGAYNSEGREFEWLRGPEPRDARKCAEAELMDFADDVAYAIHDVEDFYRTGLIPLDRLVRDKDEVDKFLGNTFLNLERNSQSVPYTMEDCKKAFMELLVDLFPINEPYLVHNQETFSGITRCGSC